VLLLLTVGLLLIGLVTLVIGFLNSSLALDYISIAASALSFALVLLFTRLGRARSARAAAASAHPAPPLAQGDTGVLDLEAAPVPEPQTATIPTASRGPSTVDAPMSSVFDRSPFEEAGFEEATDEEEDELDDARWEPQPPRPSEPTRVPQSRSPYERPSHPGVDDAPPPPAPLAQDGYADADGEAGFEDYEDLEFPIADYDDLRVAEIVPLLEELEPDEIEEVRQRELAGRSRAVILQKLDEVGGLDAGPDAGATRTTPVVNGTHPPRSWQEPAQARHPDLEYGDEDQGYDDGYGGAEDEYEEEEPRDDYGPGEPEFPIADYEELRLTEILPLLPQLEPTELELVRQRELAGEGRATLLNRIDALIGSGPSRSPARQLR
jgi:hypothetical protein